MIRKAKPEDYKYAAPLMIQAMEDLAKKFTKSDDLDLALPVFEFFFQQKANQYSYENTLVFVEEEEVLGSITAYDGAKLDELRKPFLEYLKLNFGFEEQPENETQAGEIYLDTISVNPNHQGKGIGKKLILAMINQAKLEGFTKVGLLVDVKNPSAKKLYEKLGFQVSGVKALMGGEYEHLTYITNEPTKK